VSALLILPAKSAEAVNDRVAEDVDTFTDLLVIILAGILEYSVYCIVGQLDIVVRIQLPRLKTAWEFVHKGTAIQSFGQPQHGENLRI
jgi:hypothetical protein